MDQKNIILYTTHCPKCLILEEKLETAGIEYIAITDIDEILNKNFLSVPWLVVDDNEPMDFSDANNWINERLGN